MLWPLLFIVAAGCGALHQKDKENNQPPPPKKDPQTQYTEDCTPIAKEIERQHRSDYRSCGVQASYSEYTISAPDTGKTCETSLYTPSEYRDYVSLQTLTESNPTQCLVKASWWAQKTSGARQVKCEVVIKTDNATNYSDVQNITDRNQSNGGDPRDKECELLYSPRTQLVEDPTP